MIELLADLITIFLFIGLFFSIWGLLNLSMKLGEMDRELRMLTALDKEIRLDKFTISCGIHVLFAKWYLNSKARQLNGMREVDDLGDVVYLFGEAKRKFLQEHLPGAGEKK